MKNKHEDLSRQILELVGGKGNVSLLIHCVTRLRFTLKDKSLVNEEALKTLPGTFGTQWSGEQLQIIIGSGVEDLYHKICQMGGFAEEKGIEENLDENIGEKKKFTFKGAFDNMIAAITACVQPVFIVFVVGGFLRLLVAMLGPTTFGLLAEDNEFLVILRTVGNVCFTFFPVFIAYSASKRFGANTLLALMLACLLISPDLAALMELEGGFHVYGIPMLSASYSASFLPALLTTWVLSKVEKFFKKLFPAAIKGIFYPLCTVLVMLPLTLCIIGPLSTVVGDGIAVAIVWFQRVLGPVATALVGAFFPLLIVTGMHHTLNSIALVEYTKFGFDTCVWAGSYFMSYQLIAISLAALILAKKTETKSVATSAFLTIGLSGISEPTLFGVMLKSKRAMLYTIIGGFAAGLYVGLFGVKMYTFSPEGFPAFLAYSGGSAGNLINGIIGCVIAFAVPFVLSLVFGMGIDENERVLFRKKKA